MKKIVILFFLLTAYSTSYSQVFSSGAKINYFIEDFETFAIPGNMYGWSHNQTNALHTWTVGTSGAHSGSQFIRINSDVTSGYMEEWLITGYINLSGTVRPTISFWWFGDRYLSLPPNNNVNFTVHVRPNDGTGWTNIFNEHFDTNSWQHNSWKQETFVLPASCINSPTVKIAFLLTGQNGGEFGFDDVVVEDNSVGIEDVNKKLKINVYPNPVTNFVHIHAPQNLGQVDIFNATGSLVLSKFVGKCDGSIDVSGLAEGLYIIGASTPHGYISSRISIIR